MASKALKSPTIRNLTKRGYCQAVLCGQSPYIRETQMTCQNVNNLFVAELDNCSPVSRVTVAFKAGSRYECPQELGVSHIIRSAAGLTTLKSSSFMITRQLAQIGASVTASGDRECLYYTLEATKDRIQQAVEYFTNMISCQEFRPWELADNIPRIKYDLAAITPQVRVIDLLHKAAFRDTLGNSLFVAPRRIGSITNENVQHYASSFLTETRAAVFALNAGVGVGSLVACNLQLGQCPFTDIQSKYHGGEARKEMGGELTHVAIAVKGAQAGTKESFALAIAARALGNGPVTKWGNDNSPLAKALGNIGPFAAAGFNVSYSDNGLFGIVMTVPKDVSCQAVKAAAKFLKNPSLSEEAMKNGKNRLKLEILSEEEDGTTLGESLAAQYLQCGNGVATPINSARSVDEITSSQVTKAMSDSVKHKLSMASVGNLSYTPYVDEL